MASERDIPFSVAQRSMAARNSFGSRMAITGSRPVAGRPGPRFFFGITLIDFGILWYYLK
jgi:hypothetical protein